MPTQRERSPFEADPAAVRTFIIGTGIGMVVVGVFCAGAVWLFSGDAGGALAVGAFCALWGGPGFGGMMGFIVHQDRVRRRDSISSDGGSSSPLRT